MLDPALRDRLLARLDESRAALLAALEGLTEQDFAGGLDAGGDGETVVRALAALAHAERAANAEVRGEAPPPVSTGRPLPPQVVHALAGASYQSRRYLESPDAEAPAASALVEGVAEREVRLAARIRARPAPEPPPVFPIVGR